MYSSETVLLPMHFFIFMSDAYMYELGLGMIRLEPLNLRFNGEYLLVKHLSAHGNVSYVDPNVLTKYLENHPRTDGSVVIG